MYFIRIVQFLSPFSFSEEWCTEDDSTSAVTQISGTDADSAENSLIFYRFIKNIPPFEIETETGELLILCKRVNVMTMYCFMTHCLIPGKYYFQIFRK